MTPAIDRKAARVAVIGVAICVLVLVFVLGNAFQIWMQSIPEQEKQRYPVLAERRYSLALAHAGAADIYEAVFKKPLAEGGAVALSLWHQKEQYWLLVTIPQTHRDFDAMSQVTPGQKIRVQAAYGTDFIGETDNAALKMSFSVVAGETGGTKK